MGEIKFNTFPDRPAEALAFLYVQSQDLSGKQPADLAEMYRFAYQEIVDKFRELNGRPPYFKTDTTQY